MRPMIVMALLAAAASPALAAKQGSIGETSTGSITITVTVAQQMQASGMPDMMETHDEASPCMWINTVTRRYDVKSDKAISWASDADAKAIKGREIDGLVSQATRPGCRNEAQALARLALAEPVSGVGTATLIVSPQ